MGSFTQRLNVICSTGNIPAFVSYEGREYRVCQIPSRWYTRKARWAEDSRAGRGHSGDVVDYEIWRVQLVRDLNGQELTLDLAHYTEPDQWRLIKVHDAPLLDHHEPADFGERPGNVLYADFTQTV
ncbi:hypothetical protein [Arthrobacter sp. RAF14]|uniref:hypothetical protein n=1 Tax=Arthrobacter sp. RAF14 TaxID=3233051 RepID=UPI003F92F25A